MPARTSLREPLRPCPSPGRNWFALAEQTRREGRGGSGWSFGCFDVAVQSKNEAGIGHGPQLSVRLSGHGDAAGGDAIVNLHLCPDKAGAGLTDVRFENAQFLRNGKSAEAVGFHAGNQGGAV